MDDPFTWLTLALIFVAALAVAANEAIDKRPALQSIFRGFFPLKGIWAYVPLICIVLGIFMFSTDYWLPSATEDAATQSEVAASNSLETASLEGDQTPLVVTGLPIERIMGFYDGRTDLQASKLIEPYNGVSVTVSGAVHNVLGSSGSGGIVAFLKDGTFYSKLRLFFEPEFSSELARLQEGDFFSARCVFDGQVDNIGVTLRECEPVDFEPS